MTITNDAIQIAIKHHQAGRLQEAESIYRQILRKTPNHPDILNLLGGLIHQMGDSYKGAELIRKAIINNPQNADFHYNLGVVLNVLGQWEDTIKAYRQALRIKPDYVEAWNNLGNILREHGQLDDAVEKYKRALELRPDYAEAWNNLSKITPDVIACWSRLLMALPNSRLIVKTKQLEDPFIQERFLRRFSRHGIDHKRINLLPKTPSYMADYNKIDIALDTFPRTGGVTTTDALWMGVPVITLAGQRYIERQGASMLKAIGLEELITSTLEEYVNKAVLLAKDYELRIELQASLRERMANSQLCNGSDLAKSLENVYRKMWHTWCKSKQYN